MIGTSKSAKDFPENNFASFGHSKERQGCTLNLAK